MLANCSILFSCSFSSCGKTVHMRLMHAPACRVIFREEATLGRAGFHASIQGTLEMKVILSGRSRPLSMGVGT